MKVFYTARRYLIRAIQILNEGGLKSLFQAAQSKLTLLSHHSSEPASVEDWLKYYQRHKIIHQKPVKDKDIPNFPKVSILVLTYNNLIFSKLCLHSIFTNTTYPNFEVVVVDNASSDETPVWLKSFAQTHPNLKVILNKENRGFASGNNQGVKEASGKFLIFLNNDTVVTRGWIERLLAHIQKDPAIGLVGPVTNATGNEARIPAGYNSPREMEAFAASQAQTKEGLSFDIRILAFFCVMARKEQYESLGGLDERYAVGMFEDDDLAVRYHQEGLRVVCAEDVFIHHFWRASFGKIDQVAYNKLFEENRRKYEEKWGHKWEPYNYR